MCRKKHGKSESPTVGIIDSQSVKTVYNSDGVGYDAGKKTKGRKRHLMTDTLGNVLEVVVHGADIQDRVGGKSLINKMANIFVTLRRVWADGAYIGRIQQLCHLKLGALMSVIKRNTDLKKFVVLPKRWIVERTIAWLNNFRRLSKDYEIRADSSVAWVKLASIRIMTKKITQSTVT